MVITTLTHVLKSLKKNILVLLIADVYSYIALIAQSTLHALYFTDISIQSDTISTSWEASSNLLQLMCESYTHPPLSIAMQVLIYKAA